jgi:hypothetical protein
MNINEELNRIKYLFGYEKGKVISEQRTETISTDVTTQGKNKISTTTKKINFEKVFTAEYATESSDPSLFIDKAYNDIIAEIKKQNPTNAPLMLTNILVTGTASNRWAKQPTSFNLSNDRKNQTYTPVPNTKTPNDAGYKSNLNLAKQRADKFSTDIQQRLVSTTEPKITFSPSLKPETNSFVVDTKGLNDPEMKQKYGNQYSPGQTISIKLNFEFVEKSEKVEVSGSEINFIKQYYRTSTWWCNGVDGSAEFNDAANQQSAKSCFTRVNGKPVWETPASVDANNKNQPPKEKNRDNIYNNFITMYQLLSKPPVIKDTSIPDPKNPVKFSVIGGAKWFFYWKGGKISKITKEVGVSDVKYFKMYNPETEKYVETGGGEVLGNEGLMAELKAALNIPKVGTNGKLTPFNPDGYRKSYDMFVAPYLGGGTTSSEQTNEPMTNPATTNTTPK